MRKALFVLSALTAVGITASVAARAEASPLGYAAALSGAVDELSVIDNVHCRPGWRHHEPNRWRRADGCARSQGGVVVVPGRTRYIYRDGVRVRVGAGDRSSTRSTTTIRSRTNINVRDGGGMGGGGGGMGGSAGGGGMGGGAGGGGMGGDGQKGGGAQKGGQPN
jgi:hypothetical protein